MNIHDNPLNQARFLIPLALQEGRDFKKIDAGISKFLLDIERTVTLFFEENPSVPKPACHHGCHWCCGFKTSAFPFEIVRIVSFLQSRLASDELTGLIRRIEKIDKGTRNLSLKQRAKLKVFCPLLVKGECIAYPVRPMSCRAHLSTDEKACKKAFQNANSNRINLCAYSLEVYGYAKRCIEQGFSEFGIDSHALELISSLRRGFQVPDLSERWIRGDRVFRMARGGYCAAC